MTTTEWSAMLLLGGVHGINPGMGWLFAVALGLQHRSDRAVWRALPPIAVGHALAIGAALLVAALAGLLVPAAPLRTAVALVLLALGLRRLRRHRHPRGGGMQVGFRDLTVWSFLMASAHGAGLMLVPFVLGMQASAGAATGTHAHHMGAPSWTWAAAAGVHTLAYFAVMAATAWLVYRKLGLQLLRTAWLNVDWAWAGALAVTGAVVLVT